MVQKLTLSGLRQTVQVAVFVQCSSETLLIMLTETGCTRKKYGIILHAQLHEQCSHTGFESFEFDI